MYVAIIYHPRMEKKSESFPYGGMSQIAFSFPKKALPPATNGRGKNSDEPIELDFVALQHDQTMFVLAEQWVHVLSYLPNKAKIDELIKQGALRVFPPDADKLGRDTTDWSDFDVVTEIVNNCRDEQWLNLCLQVDRRVGENGDGDVRKLIAERVRSLREDIEAQNKFSGAMGMR